MDETEFVISGKIEERRIDENALVFKTQSKDNYSELIAVGVRYDLIGRLDALASVAKV